MSNVGSLAITTAFGTFLLATRFSVKMSADGDLVHEELNFHRSPAVPSELLKSTILQSCLDVCSRWNSSTQCRHIEVLYSR